jgi:hypothetical protein
MARVPFVEENEHPELAPLVARIKAERGKVLDLYKVLLHSPAIMEGWLSFSTSINRYCLAMYLFNELTIRDTSVLSH